MKKQLIIVLLSLIIILGCFTWYSLSSKKEEIDPIEQIELSYKNFEFKNLNEKKDNLFKLDEYKINYDMSKESTVVKINNNSISAYLIDDILHIMTSSNIDYKYPDLGEINRLMFYKWCNCNRSCYKLIILTEAGDIYYIDLSDDINFDDPTIFKKLESNLKFKNIGYVNNLKIDDTCGINGLGLLCDNNETVIYDNEFNIFKQEYFDYLKLNDHILYVYPTGIISLDNYEKHINSFSHIYVSNDLFYLVGIDSYLYKLELDNTLTKVSNKKISKIGYDKKNTIIVIYSDATAKKINISGILGN